MKKVFVNFSNHASNKWSSEQIAATIGAEIVDIQFPNVPPTASTEDIQKLAVECANQIIETGAQAALVAGESTLLFHVVKELKRHEIKVVAACSERKVQETTLEDGSTQKNVIFTFHSFREF